MKTLIIPPPSSSLFIVASSLLLIISATASASAWPLNNTDIIIKRICRRAGKEQVADCLRVLYGEPKTKLITDLKGLANIALDLGKDNATHCVEAINNLHSKPGLPPALYPILLNCSNLFQIGARNFDVAKADLENDALTANYDVMLVYDGPRDCDQLMANQNVTNPQVQALGDNLRFFANIGDVITTALIP